MAVNSMPSWSAKVKLWVGAQHDLDDISARIFKSERTKQYGRSLLNFARIGKSLLDPFWILKL